MTSLKFLRTVFLVDLFQGLWVTFRNQDPKRIYTEQYPAERPKVGERYRGAPRLNINPDVYKRQGVLFANIAARLILSRGIAIQK